MTLDTVVNISSIGGNADFSLVGNAGDYFVLNVSGAASFTGSTGIHGVDASHVLINLYNSSLGNLGVVAHVGDVLNGTIFVPYDATTFHSENGAIFAGNGLITLMSGATVTEVPFTQSVPDGGASLLLLCMGLGFLVTARKKLLG